MVELRARVVLFGPQAVVVDCGLRFGWRGVPPKQGVFLCPVQVGGRNPLIHLVN